MYDYDTLMQCLQLLLLLAPFPPMCTLCHQRFMVAGSSWQWHSAWLILQVCSLWSMGIGGVLRAEQQLIVCCGGDVLIVIWWTCCCMA